MNLLPWHMLGIPRHDQGASTDGAALFADRRTTSGDHILHQTGIQLIAVAQALQHLRQQLNRCDAVQRAIGSAFAARSSDMIENECFGHLRFSYTLGLN